MRMRHAFCEGNVHSPDPEASFAGLKSVMA